MMIRFVFACPWHPACYFSLEAGKACNGQKIRCHWVNPANTGYLRYHDEEWGRPVHDDHMLFEMLILE